jgi:hypothetical protein
MERIFLNSLVCKSPRSFVPLLALIMLACLPSSSQANSRLDLLPQQQNFFLKTLSTYVETEQRQVPLSVSQLPSNPLPNDSFEQSFDEETYRAPLPEDYYNHGQQVGQYAVSSGYSYDPLSVCQHLSGEFAQQCMTGYSNGYGVELSSEEISSYYYSQGYQSGKRDAETGHDYAPHESGYHALHDDTARREWADGYHSGYWETVAE